MNDADAVAVELGRHYVAGHLDAVELDERVERAFATPEAPGAALAGLPGLEPAAPSPVRSRKGWLSRRHGETDGAQPHWLPTRERFLDPTTDRLMRVWLDPQTRARHYVPEPAS